MAVNKRLEQTPAPKAGLESRHPPRHPLTSLSLFTPSELSPPRSHHTGSSVCLARSSPAFGELGSPNSGLSAEVALQAAAPTTQVERPQRLPIPSSHWSTGEVSSSLPGPRAPGMPNVQQVPGKGPLCLSQ